MSGKRGLDDEGPRGRGWQRRSRVSCAFRHKRCFPHTPEDFREPMQRLHGVRNMRAEGDGVQVRSGKQINSSRSIQAGQLKQVKAAHGGGRMSFWLRWRVLSAVAWGAMVCVTGCHNNQTPANESQTTAQPSQEQDPAGGNLAPVSSGGTGQAESTPAPAAESENNQPAASAPAEAENDQQPEATAPQPPPALPEYQQPPNPGDGYVWTPGYWAWGTTGYYWVPGVWVAPPYVGALWTPGYWGYSGGRYGWFAGHWGRHIGYYGGINYGFGYTGLGYEGGYWRSGHFFYNRAYNNVDVNRVHNNVYNYTARTRVMNTSRVSFNGGRGGLEARPRPEEMAARREPIAPKMQSQVRYQQSFRTNRAQYPAMNHGRPQNFAASRPVEADRNVQPRMATPPRGGPGRAQPRPENRPEERRR